MQPKYTRPITYAYMRCISIPIFPESSGYFCLSKPLTVTQWWLPSKTLQSLCLKFETGTTLNIFTPCSDHTAYVREENKFSCSALGKLTSLTLAPSQFEANLHPTKSPRDRSGEKMVVGCMRTAHFLKPPLVLFNHLVRGAQTMPCMALKGHHNIALSTFTPTKLNGPW